MMHSLYSEINGLATFDPGDPGVLVPQGESSKVALVWVRSVITVY